MANNFAQSIKEQSKFVRKQKSSWVWFRKQWEHMFCIRLLFLWYTLSCFKYTTFCLYQLQNHII